MLMPLLAAAHTRLAQALLSPPQQVVAVTETVLVKVAGVCRYPSVNKVSTISDETTSTYLNSLRGSRRADQDRDGPSAARVANKSAAASRFNTRILASIEFTGWTDGTICVSQ